VASEQPVLVLPGCSHSLSSLMAQSKNWIGTSFDEEMVLPPRTLLEYACYQREKCPSSGKLHWQFFVVFTTKRRFKGAKSLLGDKVHLELCKCPEKGRLYCMKEETRESAPIEIGHFGSPECMVDILRKRSICEVLKEQPQLWRSVRQMQVVQDLLMEKRTNQPKCILLTGVTGSGKSKIASLIAQFVGSSYFKPPGKWWDHYLQQELVVIDEFRGQETMIVQEFLTLVNHLPYIVERKGSSVQFASDWIFLTSNLSVEDMYKHVDILTLNAIKRRVTVLHVY